MEKSISIPKPCHESWNAMLPEEQGRHCLACSKTVIDFTAWETDDIAAYLRQKNDEKVCGRFKREQVTVPPDPETGKLIYSVLKARVPFLRKVAAVIFICFGLLSGSDSHAQKVKGKVVCPKPNPKQHLLGEPAVQADTTVQKPPVMVDTLKPKPQIMGMIAPYHPPKKDKTKK